MDQIQQLGKGKKLKIAILVPTMDWGPTRFWISLLYMKDILLTRGHSITTVINTTSYPIDIKREMMVEDALKANPDYIMFLDADMLFDPLLFDQLYVEPPIMVSGLIHKKVVPFSPTVYCKVKPEKDEHGNKISYKHGLIEEEEHGLRAIDICGTAACLIPTFYFQKIKRPWFKIMRRNYKHAKIIGEDFYFCKKLRKAGLPILVNIDAKVRHSGGDATGFENYLYYREPIKRENLFQTRMIKEEKEFRRSDRYAEQIKPSDLIGQEGRLPEHKQKLKFEPGSVD